MAHDNKTMGAYFIIEGISDDPKLQIPIFILALLIYLTILACNMMILLLIFLDPQLKIPMYFFLGNLSIMDIASPLFTIQNIMTKFIFKKNEISFLSCLAQMYIFLFLTDGELFLLTAMSYDRYVAICNPLSYNMVMSHKVCIQLVIFCWVMSFVQVLPYLILLLNLSCYKSNIINHFFCDFMSVLKLSCSDTSVLLMFIYTEGLLISFIFPFFLIAISYIYIIFTILKIRSSSGRHKAFYTCSAHLAVVVLLYGTLVFQYLITTASDTLDSNKFFSLLNTAAVPILNPIIYSLKNKDVKSALSRLLKYYKTIL